MTQPLRRPATNEAVLLWILHRFGEEFTRRAVVKGGMALRLAGCPRSTTDVDYVFFPAESKRKLAPQVRKLLAELEGARVDVTVNSRMLRATIVLDAARVQVEASLADDCPSEPMSTGEMASTLGQPAQVVRVMTFPLALAHKLAAWNERRLLRDLYDAYFLRARMSVRVDRATLEERLAHIESRLPALRGTSSMTMPEFGEVLRRAAEELDTSALEAELAPLLPPTELAGLLLRIRPALIDLAESLAAGRS
jgi:predicted nucleotidyltransferase component of viral defense system